MLIEKQLRAFWYQELGHIDHEKTIGNQILGRMYMKQVENTHPKKKKKINPDIKKGWISQTKDVMGDYTDKWTSQLRNRLWCVDCKHIISPIPHGTKCKRFAGRLWLVSHLDLEVSGIFQGLSLPTYDVLSHHSKLLQQVKRHPTNAHVKRRDIITAEYG